MSNTKWHIYDMEHYPLCWDNEALEFDTRKSAEEFLISAELNGDQEPGLFDEVVIVQDILLYKGGRLNATHLRVSWTLEEDYCELIPVKDK